MSSRDRLEGTMNDHDDRGDIDRPDQEPASDHAERTRANVELDDRYATVGDCTGRTLVFDVENADAWVRSDTVLDVEDWR